MKVLATGATGKFASLVVPALVSHGIEVRAVSRCGQWCTTRARAISRWGTVPARSCT
jgi:nucleoside-diphosphate-sugar epimerase